MDANYVLARRHGSASRGTKSWRRRHVQVHVRERGKSLTDLDRNRYQSSVGRDNAPQQWSKSSATKSSRDETCDLVASCPSEEDWRRRGEKEGRGKEGNYSRRFLGLALAGA